MRGASIVPASLGQSNCRLARSEGSNINIILWLVEDGTSVRARVLLNAGALGGRLDHTLSSLNVLHTHSHLDLGLIGGLDAHTRTHTDTHTERNLAILNTMRALHSV